LKVLFDSNVWVSALATRGLCADLLRHALRRHGRGDFELLICAAVCKETQRILRDKFGAPPATLHLAQVAMSLAREVPEPVWLPPDNFPDPDDVVIVGAALAARADALITGDKALLDLGRVENLPILNPRTAYERLVGLH